MFVRTVLWGTMLYFNILFCFVFGLVVGQPQYRVLTWCPNVDCVFFNTLCAFFKGLHVTAASLTFNLRKVELTPLEQRKLTFDSHAMVSELQRNGGKNNY